MEVGYMSWYTKEEIEKLLEDEELRKLHRPGSLPCQVRNFLMKYTPIFPLKSWKNTWRKIPVKENI